jgi:uncharacterized protein with PIN domain
MNEEREQKQEMICELCNVKLEPMEAHFTYLKRTFRHIVPRCPVCGIVYIPEDTAEGRMKQVETALEDK